MTCGLTKVNKKANSYGRYYSVEYGALLLLCSVNSASPEETDNPDGICDDCKFCIIRTDKDTTPNIRLDFIRFRSFSHRELYEGSS